MVNGTVTEKTPDKTQRVSDPKHKFKKQERNQITGCERKGTHAAISPRYCRVFRSVSEVTQKILFSSAIKVPDYFFQFYVVSEKQTVSSTYLSTPSQFSLAQVLKYLQCQFIRQLDIKERNLIYFILKRKKEKIIF